MARTDDRRWLIVAVNVMALFVVLGRPRELWAGPPLGVAGPYLLWIALAVLAGLVAWLWTERTA